MTLHRFPRLALLALLLVVALAPAAATGEWVWAGEEGWVNMNQAPPQSAQGLYTYGRGLLIRGDYAAAIEALEEVEQRFPKSPLATKARFSRAYCEARMGRYLVACRLDRELLNSAPEALRPEEVFNHLLEVLKEYGRDYPAQAAGLVGAVRVDAPTEEQRAMARLLEGDLRYASGEYDLARAAFERVIDSAAARDTRQEALLGAGLMDLAACRDIGHNTERLERAATRFERYLQVAESDVEVETGQQYLWIIKNAQRESDAKRRHIYYAATYLQEKRYDEAEAILKKGARKWRGAPTGEIAHFFLAECRFRRGEYWRAYKSYEDFLSEYPATDHLPMVVRREFAIGKELKNSGRNYRAIQAFEMMVEHAPTGALADDGLMFAGYCHLERMRYNEAQYAFETIVTDFPNSEWYDAAIFNGGKADLMENAYRSDNENTLARARRSLEAYLERQPDGIFAAEAKRLTDICRARQAEAAMKIAEFYERRDLAHAANVYYEEIANAYPETRQALHARRRLAQREQEEITAP